MMINKNEVLAKAIEIDPIAGEYIALSVIDRVSFDMIEKKMACKGECIPISRSNFYRRKRKLQHLLNKETQ